MKRPAFTMAAGPTKMSPAQKLGQLVVHAAHRMLRRIVEHLAAGHSRRPFVVVETAGGHPGDIAHATNCRKQPLSVLLPLLA